MGLFPLVWDSALRLIRPLNGAGHAGEQIDTSVLQAGSSAAVLALRASWSQSLSNSAQTDVTGYAAVDFNDFTASTWASGSLTIAAADVGTYQVSARAISANGATDVAIYLYVNGVVRDLVQCYASGGGAGAGLSMPVRLVAGDVVRIRARILSSTTPQTCTGVFALVRQ